MAVNALLLRVNAPHGRKSPQSQEDGSISRVFLLQNASEPEAAKPGQVSLHSMQDLLLLNILP